MNQIMIRDDEYSYSSYTVLDCTSTQVDVISITVDGFSGNVAEVKEDPKWYYVTILRDSKLNNTFKYKVLRNSLVRFALKNPGKVTTSLYHGDISIALCPEGYNANIVVIEE